jgi:hypothetical protein
VNEYASALYGIADSHSNAKVAEKRRCLPSVMSIPAKERSTGAAKSRSGLFMFKLQL